jgi:hypothetical protein
MAMLTTTTTYRAIHNILLLTTLFEAELQELVEYAADRAVRIYPEFDVPGHAGTASLSSS